MIQILVKLLDPVSFILCLILTLFSINKLNFFILILVVSVVVAIAIETTLDAMQYTRVWGEGIIAGLFASMVHTFLSIKILNAWKKYKDGKTSD